MKVYNTLTRRKEIFTPIVPNKISMYVCGPTVYDYLHIGNARPYVVFDTIRRYLEYKGFEVTYVQNFTDIDDKIIARAKSEDKTTNEIAEKFIKEALIDAKNLNIEPSINPRATAVIPEMIELISTLIAKGYAYEKSGTVYFDTNKFKNYGALSRKNIDDLIAGNRISQDENKKNPTDFVLWKPYKIGEPKWESPWGFGRPGWHTECCAIVKKYLGTKIDIHAGGEDLIFPHHENEIAQSEAYSGEKFVNYWLHNGFINVDNEKMSKSKGNFFTIRQIAEKFSYDIIRFFILSVHYRNPINFSDEQLEAAKTSLERIKTCLFNINFMLENLNDEPQNNLYEQCDKYVELFEKNMDDDFNTAGAIGIIFDLVRFANSNINQKSSKKFALHVFNKIILLCKILGLEFDFKNHENFDIINLIDERTKAKKNKNWQLADEIRNKLSAMGIILEDTPNGTRWKKIN